MTLTSSPSLRLHLGSTGRLGEADRGMRRCPTEIGATHVWQGSPLPGGLALGGTAACGLRLRASQPSDLHLDVRLFAVAGGGGGRPRALAAGRARVAGRGTATDPGLQAARVVLCPIALQRRSPGIVIPEGALRLVLRALPVGGERAQGTTVHVLGSSWLELTVLPARRPSSDGIANALGART